ncbi:MAG TPA: methyltransferase domain-containing protein [Ktedonobacteraceae bacterium]|nr:methyltransferase domain-containing protein [Ktedonobacteraceae bacterium]
MTANEGKKYVFDAESATETARLMYQGRLLTSGTQGPLSEQTDLASIHDVLDVACGPGAWTLDVAHRWPHMQLTGVDISRTTIKYARTQAEVQNLQNVAFEEMDIYQSFAFPDASFDLVNARLLFGVLMPSQWPTFLQECRRVTRPGGIIRLTEWEIGFTNKPAMRRMLSLFTQALKLAGRTFSPDGASVGLINMLAPLLRNAGCQDVQNRAYAVDMSVGTPDSADWFQDGAVAIDMAKPLLLKTGLISEEDFDRSYQEMLAEMFSDDVYSMLLLLTVWGRVPG